MIRILRAGARYASAVLLLTCFFFSTSLASSMLHESNPILFERTGSGYSLVLERPVVSWCEVVQGGEEMIIEGAGVVGEAGGPQLPVYSQLIAIPAGMDLIVGDVSVHWGEAEEHQLAHDVGFSDEYPAAKRGELFTDSVDDGAEVQVVSCGRWRDLRVAHVVVRVARTAGANQVEIVETINASLELVPAADDDGIDPPGISEAMLPVYKAFIPNALDELEGELTRGSILFIVDEAQVGALQPLLKWRRRCGFNVILHTTDGYLTTVATKAIIEEAYASADPPLDYVVLVGDVDDIQTFTIPGEVTAVETDQKYTYNEATEPTFENVLPRFHIGRISVSSNTELATVVAKTLKYEREPFVGNVNRWHDAVLLADASGAASTEMTQRWIKTKMRANNFRHIYLMVYDGSYAISRPDFINYLDQGVSWVGYRGYGGYDYWTGFAYDFNNYHIEDLDNPDNLPVITSMVCGGGAFSQGSGNVCFGEAWIRAGSPTALKGAAAFIGPSELSTHTRWNNMMLAGWYTSLFDDGMRTMGQCMLGAKQYLYNAYPLNWNAGGSSSSSVWFYFHTYNILGDPALQVRAGDPRSFAVTAPETINQNDASFVVMVQDSEGYSVPGASVALTQAEATIIDQVFTDETGRAILLTEGISLDDLELTVTHPDFEPWDRDLALGTVQGLTLTGVETTEVSGDEQTNQDSVLNPGELVDVAVTFHAEADANYDNVTFELSLVDETLGEVIAGTQTFASITSGSEIVFDQGQVRLAPNLRAGTDVEFLIRLQGGQQGLLQTFYVEAPSVQAPLFVINQYQYSTEPLPGSVSELTISLECAEGGTAANTVSGTLVIDNDDITVEGTGEWSSLSIGEVDDPTAPFTVTVDGGAIPGHQIAGTLELTTSEGYITRLPYLLEVAGVTQDTPTGPAGPGYCIYEDTDLGYDFTPGYEYESIANNPAATRLQDIRDYGENRDAVQEVDLPFLFSFWDSMYDEITVCSNGWVSFEKTQIPFFRNRPIPSPLSPAGAVCAFWDDLIFVGNSGVFTMYDEGRDVFIIEWNNMRHLNGYTPINFQILLFGPETHGAPGGLGQIGILYSSVSNNDSYENFATVGLISPDCTSGLQYQFSSFIAASARGVETDRQLLIAAAEGDGLEPPIPSVDETFVQMNSVVGLSSGSSIHINNDGQQSLRFKVIAELMSIPPVGEVDDLNTLSSEDGGGYFWYDSHESFGPATDWIAIESDENEVTLNGGMTDGGASVSGPFEIPFEYQFYGQSVTSFWICESGYVTFQDPGEHGSYTNTPLPRAYAPALSAFPFWDNIGTDQHGAVYCNRSEDRVVVTWSELERLDVPGEEHCYTFQLELLADGRLAFRYHTMQGNLGSATVGTNGAMGDAGLEIALNTNVSNQIENEYAICISRGMPWLSFTPEVGSVSGSSSRRIAILCNSDDLAPGYYRGRLLVDFQLLGTMKEVGFELFVAEENLGYRPLLSEIPGQSIGEGESFVPVHLNAYVDDWDNAPSEIYWRTMDVPEGITATISEDNLLTIDADETWAGPGMLKLMANDPSYNREIAEITLDRAGNNDKPFFVSVTPPSVGYIEPGSEFRFTVQAEDPEGEDVTYTWYHGEETVGTGTVCTRTFATMGNDSVRVVAADAWGQSAVRIWKTFVYDNDAKDEREENLPNDFALESVYPNPFNARMVVQFALPETANVKLYVYNLLGQEVGRMSFDHASPGRHRATFNASNWSSGLYFIRCVADHKNFTRKAVLVK